MQIQEQFNKLVLKQIWIETIMLFTIEEAKETALDFSQGTEKVLIFISIK